MKWKSVQENGSCLNSFVSFTQKKDGVAGDKPTEWKTTKSQQMVCRNEIETTKKQIDEQSVLTVYRLQSDKGE